MELSRLLSVDDVEDPEGHHDTCALTRQRMKLSHVLSDASATTDTRSEEDDNAPPPHQSDGPVPTATVTCDKNTVTRSIQSTAVVKRGRRTPVNTVVKLRAQVEALEVALANWSDLLDKHGQVTALRLPATSADEGDDNGQLKPKHSKNQRMLEYLQRMIPLYELGKKHEAERAELLRLLKPYYAQHAALRRLTRGAAMDDWHWRCERWTAMTDAFYVPWSHAKCTAKIEEMLAYIKNYKSPTQRAKGDEGMFGWVDKTLVEGGLDCIHIESKKITRSADADEITDRLWKLLNSREQTQATFFDPNTQYYHRILQQVSPGISIIQSVEKYAGCDVMFHYCRWRSALPRRPIGSLFRVRSTLQISNGWSKWTVSPSSARCTGPRMTSWSKTLMVSALRSVTRRSRACAPIIRPTSSGGPERTPTSSCLSG